MILRCHKFVEKLLAAHVISNFLNLLKECSISNALHGIKYEVINNKNLKDLKAAIVKEYFKVSKTREVKMKFNASKMSETANKN